MSEKEKDIQEKEQVEEKEPFDFYKGKIPSSQCSYFGALTMKWAEPMIYRTQTEKVTVSEMGDLHPSYEVKPNYQKLKDSWDQYRSQDSSIKLIKASLYAYRKNMTQVILSNAFICLKNVIKPILFERLINNIIIDGDKTFSLKIATLGAFIQVVFTIFEGHMWMHICLTGDIMRTSIESLVFDKQLTVSSSSNKKYTDAQITNLINAHSQKIQGFAHIAPQMIRLPLMMMFCFYYLYTNLGSSFGFGMIVFVIGFIINFKLSQIQRKNWSKLRANYEKRIEITDEGLKNVQTLKLNAWTKIWQKFMGDARWYEHEQWYITTQKNALIELVTQNIGPVLSCVTYTMFFYFGNTMELGAAFAISQVLELFRETMGHIPGILSWIQEAQESFDIIQGFLTVDDANQSFIETQDASGISSGPKSSCDQEYAIQFINGNFHWGAQTKSDENTLQKEKDEDESKKKEAESKVEEKKSEEKQKTLEEFCILKNLNFKIRKGEFVTVIGDVGSGKSSLLNAIIGDMLCMDHQFYEDLKDKSCSEEMLEKIKSHSSQKSNQASIKLNGSVCYTQQTPWILNRTLRENIIFGEPMDEERYNQTMNICQMAKDIELLENGDLTEIGEKGINLSGGQKARVGLARAVYAEKDIILMDDPVSALDSQVKKKIFEHVLMGALKDKTRILATHAIDFLDVCDSIILLDKGKVIFKGPYEEVKDNEYLKKLIAIHKAHKEQGQESEEESELEEDYLSGMSSDSNEHQLDPQVLFFNKSSKEQSQMSAPSLSRIQSMKKSMSRKKSSRVFKPFKVDLSQDGKAKKLMTNEDDEKSERTGLEIYKQYISYGGGIQAVIVLNLILISQKIVPIFVDLHFGEWVLSENQQDSLASNASTYFFYTFLGCCTHLAWGRAVDYYNFAKAYKLYEDMMDSVLKAPVNLYFQVTPIGKITKRFTSDIGEYFGIPHVMGHFSRTLFGILTTIIFAASEVPQVLFVMIPAFFILQDIYYFTKEGQIEIERVESVNSTPRFTFQSENLTGVSTIRAYQKQEQQKEQNFKLKTDCIRCWVWCHATHRYKEVRLQLISQLFVYCITVLCITNKSGDQRAVVLMPLLINYCEQLTWQFGGLFWVLTDFEKRMKKADNCFQMLKIKPEKFEGKISVDELNSQAAKKSGNPEAKWPARGDLEFKDVVLRYRPDCETVLKGLTFKLKAGEKLGIIGRTGAGKSTLTLAISRLIEIEKGSVTVDGQNIQDVELDYLRSRITVIPQDPVLFTGTLRRNLDPLEQFTDERIIDVLNRAKLDDIIKRDPKGLLQEIRENGKNFSSGERQIVCICRAILKANKVVLLDEATSNIDVITEQKIQALIKREFKDATMLTVAHRLNTIIASDKIMMLDKGRNGEFGSPKELMNDPKSGFNTYLEEIKKEEQTSL